MSRAWTTRARSARRGGATVIQRLAALIDHAMAGRVIEVADDVSSPLRLICSNRIFRLHDEPEDLTGLVELIVAEIGLETGEQANLLAHYLIYAEGGIFLNAWLETLVAALSIERQSSLFGLAVAVWAISEAKCGPVNSKSDHTPGIDRVIANVGLIINGDFKGSAALFQRIGDALRHNPHIWQLEGRLLQEWSGD